MRIHNFHTYTFSLTGLSDQGHEGRWVWQHSVEDVDFESWAPGQPEGIVSFILKQTILDCIIHFQYDDCACMDYQNEYMWVAKRWENEREKSHNK